jgi:hypothetical protein
MLILILTLYLFDTRARLLRGIQFRTRMARLAARWGPLRRFAAPRQEVPGRTRGEHDGVSTQDE